MNNREIHKKLDNEYSITKEIEDSYFLPWQFQNDDMHRYSAKYKDGSEIQIKLNRNYPEDNTHYKI